jgi:hypothetical protein
MKCHCKNAITEFPWVIYNVHEKNRCTYKATTTKLYDQSVTMAGWLWVLSLPSSFHTSTDQHRVSKINNNCPK